MRKLFAAAALAGSIAVTGLTLAAPAAQAATSQTTASSVKSWGKYYSSNRKAYTYGKTWKSGGRVYTHWYGKESTPKKGYVWFKYYSGGNWHSFYRGWNGSYHETWSQPGIKKLYTYTCWGGPTKYCGPTHRIY
ncbi:hypothetical protein ACBR40_32775 [Nonomuraea sp. AD125B]|jgi:hypothetical protein|uniref:hypothetical protein n=1 Tax=Nonomuraea TaxID=83681 RepID=UPI0031D4B00C